MKKVLAAILIVMTLCSICMGSAVADFQNQLQSYIDASTLLEETAKANLPSIDEVLSDLNSYSGKVEVKDDLSEYDPDNFGENDYGNFKLVILERHLPEKEFTKFDSGYPDNYVTDLPEDFEGKDIGISHVWVRCDLMNQLPEEFSAASMEDADIIIIAETQYFWSGTITVSDFSKTSDEEIPEFETIDEMLEYMRAHQPVIEKIWYYPKFAVYTLVDLYSSDTKKCEVYDYTTNYAKRFASNPDAADKWYDMQDLAKVFTELASENADLDYVNQALEYFKDVIPQSKLDFWQTCIDSGEYTAAGSSMDEYFWIMASELMELDQDENHQANYKLVIDARDMEALCEFAEFCNYSGFDTPVETIQANKEYLATPDYDWLETSMNELVSEFQ